MVEWIEYYNKVSSKGSRSQRKKIRIRKWWLGDQRSSSSLLRCYISNDSRPSILETLTWLHPVNWLAYRLFWTFSWNTVFILPNGYGNLVFARMDFRERAKRINDFMYGVCFVASLCKLEYLKFLRILNWGPITFSLGDLYTFIALQIVKRSNFI